VNAQRKTAVVTGASSGIGLGIAKALLGRSWNVVGNARTQARLDEAATQLDAGERFLGVAGDIAKPDTSKRLFDSTIDRFGHVDLLVNNAGIFLPKPFVDFTPDEIEDQIATNVKGVVFASQEAARRMIAGGKGGHIVNITAALAMQPRSNVPAFLAVLLKGGLNAATRGLALELAPHGIRVNAIAPGCTDTPMFAATDQLPGYRELVSERAALGRVGTADEIAAAIVALVQLDWVTGHVLVADGGITLRSPLDPTDMLEGG